MTDALLVDFGSISIKGICCATSGLTNMRTNEVSMSTVLRFVATAAALYVGVTVDVRWRALPDATYGIREVFGRGPA
jgi:hypothetical protein